MVVFEIGNSPLRGVGFTLVELLVVFSLVSIVSGIGFASFASYSRRQVVVQAAANFKQTVDLARFNALSQVKPATCGSTDELSSFKVNVCSNAICQTSGVDYELNVTCAGLEQVQDTKILPQNITFSDVVGSPTCANITFNTVSGIIIGVPCEIFVNGYGNQIKIQIDSNGHVSY
ncbi:MAG: type II secretion system protein [Candidatus Levybacteria bacterium]|nr:type II secretion system protein [Candidatus Levybacteria bacterium]